MNKRNILDIYIKSYKNGKKLHWESSGLFYSLESSQIEQLEYLFNSCIGILSKRTNYNDEKNSFYLPLIRRVYVDLIASKISNLENRSQLYYLIDVKHLLTYFDNLYSTSLVALSKLKNIDYEAELCRLIANDYLSMLVNQNDDPKSLSSKLLVLNRDYKINKII